MYHGSRLSCAVPPMKLPFSHLTLSVELQRQQVAAFYNIIAIIVASGCSHYGMPFVRIEYSIPRDGKNTNK